jgi:hypothetical protein
VADCCGEGVGMDSHLSEKPALEKSPTFAVNKASTSDALMERNSLQKSAFIHRAFNGITLLCGRLTARI